MKIVFFHSHKFRKINDEYYSLGGLSTEVLERYLKYCDTLVVVARVIDEKKIPPENYSKITDNRIVIKDYRTMSLRRLKEEIESADSVVGRLPCMISTIGLRIAKKMHKNILAEVVACAWDALWYHSFTGKLIAPFMFLITRNIVKNMQYVLYVSTDFLQKRYPTKGISVACSDVNLPNVDSSILQNRIEKIKKKQNNKKIVLGTIGAVNVRYKGQQYVIRSLKNLIDKGYNIEYQIVGNGDNSFLSNAAKRYGVSNRVKFIGSIPHDRIFEWLDNIDIYVQPSNQEGLCRALIEAMSRGCPCIASSAGGNPELINNKFVFRKKRYKQLISAIINIQNEMIYEAKYNFDNSSNYNKSILDERRNNFFKKVFKECDE